MKKNKILAMGLVVGAGALIGNELGMFGDKDNGDIPQRIKQRAGGILGSQADYGAAPGAPAPSIYNIPAAGEVSFPAPRAFDLSKILSPIEPAGAIEAQSRGIATRGGGGDFAIAESIPMPADITKKEGFIASVGGAMGESYAARGKGLGGLTAFREAKAVLPSKVRGEPTPRFGKKEAARAPVAAGLGYVSGGVSSLWGAMKESYATKGKGMGGVKKYDYRGSGMTQSEYKSQFAERTFSTGISGEAVTPKKPSAYVRRSEIGYTYVDGVCVTKASVSSKKEIKTSGGNSSGGEK